LHWVSVRSRWEEEKQAEDVEEEGAEGGIWGLEGRGNIGVKKIA
jgi:hypothetical protein